MDLTITVGFWFYVTDVDQLSEPHPAVHEEFMSGNLSISRSTQPFAQVWSDMALEHSINLDSKTSTRDPELGNIGSWCATNEQQLQQLFLVVLLCAKQNNIIMKNIVCFTIPRPTWYTQRGSTETDIER